MGLLFVLLVIIVAITAYLWYRQKQVVPAEAPPPSNRFHAVAIHAPVNACPEVRTLTSKNISRKRRRGCHWIIAPRPIASAATIITTTGAPKRIAEK